MKLIRLLLPNFLILALGLPSPALALRQMHEGTVVQELAAGVEGLLDPVTQTLPAAPSLLDLTVQPIPRGLLTTPRYHGIIVL